MHSHGETKVTVGAGSLPNVEATTTNANIVNGARFTVPGHIMLRLLREAIWFAAKTGLAIVQPFRGQFPLWRQK